MGIIDESADLNFLRNDLVAVEELLSEAIKNNSHLAINQFTQRREELKLRITNIDAELQILNFG